MVVSLAQVQLESSTHFTGFLIILVSPSSVPMVAQAIAMQADLHQHSLMRLPMGKPLLVCVLCIILIVKQQIIPKPACENGLTPLVCGIACTIHSIGIAQTHKYDNTNISKL